jgi:hypothetical protein
MFRESEVDYEGIDSDICDLIASMLAGDPSVRPTVAQTREHCIFCELPRRPKGFQSLDIASPMVELNEVVLGNLANTLEMEQSLLRSRLVEFGSNREKVLYALALRADIQKMDEVSVNREKVRMSKSLPIVGTLSVDFPICLQKCCTLKVAESRDVVISGIVEHLLDQKFVMSMKSSGSREFVLNQVEDDITVDIDVSSGNTAGNSLVVMRGKDARNCPAMEELQQFIESRFSIGSM